MWSVTYVVHTPEAFTSKKTFDTLITTMASLAARNSVIKCTLHHVDESHEKTPNQDLKRELLY